MIRNRPELFTVCLGLVLIIVVLAYCAVRIKVTQDSLERIEEGHKVIIDHIRREEMRWTP